MHNGRNVGELAMNTEPELLNERLERLAIVLDEIMPQCALLVRDAIVLLKEQEPMQPKNIWHSIDHTSIRKNGDCPKCGGEVNEFDNSMLCGRCGQSLDWRNL